MLEQRKREHLEICLTQDVSSTLDSGFEHYALVHQALPEINLGQVSLGCTWLSHNLQAPLLISAMTGGTDAAFEINIRLAQAAQHYGLALGLGSQRAAIEHPELASTFQVRRYAPDILLLANLGAIQLNNGFGAAECRQAVASVGADALVLHLNPLQEALQNGGNTNFGGLLGRIADVCSALEVPVVVKEVGDGLSVDVAGKLLQAGVAALDIAGAGGTSWSEVERLRAAGPLQERIAAGYKSWGIPTAEALVNLRQAFPQASLVASGGIRDGIAIAKAFALGADLAGIARPLLLAANQSFDTLCETLEVFIEQLRISMFCTGSQHLSDLRRAGVVVPRQP